MPKFSVYFYWLVSCILPIAALAQTTAKESGTAAVKITFSYGNNKDYAGQNTALKADLYKPSLFFQSRNILRTKKTLLKSAEIS